MPETSPPPSALAGLSLSDIAQAAAERRLPPVERWDPVACGSSEMVIARDGTWYHQGAPITRPAMVRLFAGLLRREPEGGYVLVTPVEKLSIEVEDLPFVAVELASEGEGARRRLAFRLNTDEPIVAGPAHPLIFGSARPSLAVRSGLYARIPRPIFYELAELALRDTTSESGAAGLWSDGTFFAMDAE